MQKHIMTVNYIEFRVNYNIHSNRSWPLAKLPFAKPITLAMNIVSLLLSAWPARSCLVLFLWSYRLANQCRLSLLSE